MPRAARTRTEKSPSRRRTWVQQMGRIAGMFLGGVFLVAAYAKVLDPGGFAETIEVERLDFLLPANVMALIVLVLETGLGVALLLGLRTLWVLLPVSGLVALFVFIMARALHASLSGELDPNSPCGCFGHLVERSPEQAFWQDLGLLVPALVLSWFGRPRYAGLPKRRVQAVAASAVLVLVLALVSPMLPIDDLATRLSEGKSIKALCFGFGPDRTCLEAYLPEVEQGQHLVLIAALDDATVIAQVEALNALARGETGEQVWLLTDAPDDAIKTWFWTHSPAFEVRHVPRGLLRPLYRRMPRSFRVRDGTVTETYDGVPNVPAADGSP